MNKIIISVLISIVCICFSSCTTAYAMASECGNDCEIVVRYGTPYYDNGILSHYYYRGYYYYPYRYNNVWRYQRYSRPLPRRPIRMYDKPQQIRLHGIHHNRRSMIMQRHHHYPRR